MTFNPAAPSNSQSPAVFPAQNRANMLRLEQMFEQDHQFNTTAQTNDGWHKIVHWVQQSGQLDPLNPGATSPSNVGGPPITWEQEDVYSVPRVWLRSENGGNVQSMTGETEIRVNGFQVTQAEKSLVIPPDNSFGTIYYQGGMGYYWKVGGLVYDLAIITQFQRFNDKDLLRPLVAFGTNPLIRQGYITVFLGNPADPNRTLDFRILYRYL